jgi:hypothetical protein
MRKYLLGGYATAALLTGSVAAHADIIPTNPSDNLLDPAAFHVGADPTGGPGTGPNPIASSTQFYIADNDQTVIAPPIDIFFAVPVINGTVSAPSITSITNSVTGAITNFTQPTLTSFTIQASQQHPDLYSQVGCSQC